MAVFTRNPLMCWVSVWFVTQSYYVGIQKSHVKCRRSRSRTVGPAPSRLRGDSPPARRSDAEEIEFRLCSIYSSLGTLVRKGGCRHEDADHHREIQSGERHASRSRKSVRSDPAR